MMISYYGRKFLKKFNEIENKNLTPREFFVDIFYSLFYSGRNLMEAINSPFTNPSYSLSTFITRILKLDYGLEWQKSYIINGNIQWNILPSEIKSNLESNLALYQDKRKKFLIDRFFEKIKNKEFDACMFIGGYAKELNSSTSFNMSSYYKHEIDEEEVIYSWIGKGLSVNMRGMLFLFDNEDILYDIYKGWKIYSKLLNLPQYEKYKSGQISTWNSHWLSDYYFLVPSRKFNPLEQYAELKSVSWIELIFRISNKFPNIEFNAYAYKLSKTNETYGNIIIETIKVNGFLNFCKTYFGDNSYLTNPDLYSKILGTAYSMEKICEFGSIGILALKPELLRLEEYFNKTAEINTKIKKLYDQTFENNFNYNLYKIYLMTKLNILNGDEFLKIAEYLHKFEDESRKNNHILVDEILDSTNYSTCLQKITEAIKICTEEHLDAHHETFRELINIISNNNAKFTDNMNLIKIQYYNVKKNKS
jgi:hypothetical protein